MNYINQINNSDNDIILGLFNDSILIGTSGVQNILSREAVPVGIFLFNENYRGVGLGNVLVWATTYLVSSYYGLNKFWANMLETNIGSHKSFINCGYKISEQKNGIIKVDLNIKDLITPNNISLISLS